MQRRRFLELGASALGGILLGATAGCSADDYLALHGTALPKKEALMLRCLFHELSEQPGTLEYTTGVGLLEVGEEAHPYRRSELKLWRGFHVYEVTLREGTREIVPDYLWVRVTGEPFAEFTDDAIDGHVEAASLELDGRRVEFNTLLRQHPSYAPLVHRRYARALRDILTIPEELPPGRRV